ncbi:MAG: FHA domain-containing protein [Lentisphaerae bacterium]|jgi:pSer/pThr/pTyr-binding forkhead associated (FHA) protein|nr:FHA domain-containing protein [Lentisphaerota bacterium]
MAHLILTGGTGQGKRYELSAEVTRLGRRPDNDVSLASGSVSSTHAEIVKTTEGFELRDLGSTNGTFLNGERVDTVRIFRNDIIRLGDVSLMLDGDDVPQATSNDDEAEMLPLSRTTVAIKPLDARDAQAATPAEFKSGNKLSKLWPLFLGAIILAIMAGIYLFVKKAMM